MSAAARRAGLRDVRTVVPDAVVDLRYATPDNFTRVRLYPTRARCLIHSSMAPGLRRAGDRARAAGLSIVFWDCYRPHYVQERMYRVVPNPAWVAKPGSSARSHEAGRSVDVTLALRRTSGACPSRVRVRGHCLLTMGTAFDAFTPRAYAYATSGVSTIARAHRAKLRRVMGSGGLVVYRGEWWHFDGSGSGVGRPFLRAPVY
ncbi:M15 family metallopeptidase [Jatrophihabitans fulvus]